MENQQATSPPGNPPAEDNPPVGDPPASQATPPNRLQGEVKGPPRILRNSTSTAAALLTLVVFFSSIYWTSPDPLSYASLIAVAATLKLELIIIFILFSLNQFSGSQITKIASFIWTDKASSPRQRIEAIAQAKALSRYRVAMSVGILVLFIVWAVMIVQYHWKERAVICKEEAAKELTKLVGAECYEADKELYGNRIICKVYRGSKADTELHVIGDWRDPLGRDFVALRDRNLPLTPGIPVSLLAEIADNLLTTSDHRDGSRNIKTLRELSSQVLAVLDPEKVLELEYEERYAVGIVNALSVIHYWIWAELANIERTNPSAEGYFRLMSSHVGKHSVRNLLDFLQQYVAKILPDAAEAFECDPRFMKSIAPLRFVYADAYYSYVIAGEVNAAARLLELADSFIAKGCHPGSMAGIWYPINLCLHLRNDSLSKASPLCQSIDTLPPALPIFSTRCKEFFALGEIRRQIGEQGHLACKNPEVHDFAATSR
jgi:hypothetical protein